MIVEPGKRIKVRTRVNVSVELEKQEIFEMKVKSDLYTKIDRIDTPGPWED